MKKIFWFCTCVVGLALSIFSCKPVLHSNNPTPANYRILSYSKTTNAQVSLPYPLLPRPIQENYRFYYNHDNKVDHIIYITNDTVNGNRDMNITFTYYHDTIVKSYYDLRTSLLMRLDTFSQNSAGFITAAYTPGYFKSRQKTTYEYLGQLLTREQRFAYRSDNGNTKRGSTITGPLTTYTSDNGDFLKHTYTTPLTANFVSNKFDTIKSVYWIYLPTDTTKHTTIPYGTYADVLPNYSQKPILMIVHDNVNNNDTVGFVGTLNNLGDLWFNESYAFYTTMANRPGDWLQIQSFTMFGNNIYRNNHLVKKIYSVKGTMDITYSIDAYSKITQVISNEKDEYLNTYSSTYDIQYEIFQ